MIHECDSLQSHKLEYVVFGVLFRSQKFDFVEGMDDIK